MQKGKRYNRTANNKEGFTDRGLGGLQIKCVICEKHNFMPKGLRGFQKGNPGGKLSAGKKRKTLEKEALLEVMKEKIDAVWGSLLDKKVELAMGVYVLKPVVVNGKVVDVKVYKEKPDGSAIEYLMERRVGKIKDEVEFSGGIDVYNDIPDELQEKITRFKEWEKKQK